MKSLIAVISLGMILLISGCVQEPGLGKGGTNYIPEFSPRDHSYLKDVQSTASFVSKNDQFKVNFVIVNPLRQLANHIVEIRYDLPNCFADNGQRTLTVPANSINFTDIGVTATLPD